jgi:hypothetical protein
LTDDFLPPFCPFVQVGTDTHTERRKRREGKRALIDANQDKALVSAPAFLERLLVIESVSLLYISHKYAHTRRRLTCSLLYIVRFFYIFIFSTRVAAAIRLSVSCSFFCLGPALAPAHLSLLGAPVAGHTGTLMRKRVQREDDGRTVGACVATGPALHRRGRGDARV